MTGSTVIQFYFSFANLFFATEFADTCTCIYYYAISFQLEAVSVIMTNLTCCIIGRSQLAIDCSKLLIKKGIIIKHVFTDDLVFQDWAKSLCIHAQGTNHLEPLFECNRVSFFAQFDYLFSIVNDIIIPLAVLNTIGEFSINYHNGPLPKYRGSNVTHWALIHGEKTHGVVWHKIDKMVDSGSVLVKRSITIETHDDLLKVNWKCREAAKESFVELCEKLLACSLSSCEPLHDEPHLYKMNDKPSAFCMLPFSCPAQQVYNFFCGTFHLSWSSMEIEHIHSLSTQPNELGLPKIFLSKLGKLFIVTKMNVLNEALKPGSVPGTLVSISDHLRVSTTDNDVMITGLMQLDGSVVSKPFNKFVALNVGDILYTEEAHIPGSLLWKLSNYSLSGKHERKWIMSFNHPNSNAAGISKSTPVLMWPYHTQTKFIAQTDVVSSTCYYVSKQCYCSIDIKEFPSVLLELSYQPEIILLASYLCYLLLLTPTMSGCFDVILRGIPNEQIYMQSIISCLPISFHLNPKDTFLKVIKDLGALLQSNIYGETKSNVRIRTVASDVFLRYSLKPMCNHIIASVIEDEQYNFHMPINKKVAILCCRVIDTINIYLVVCPSIQNNVTANEDFLTFLSDAFKCPAKARILCHRLCSDSTSSFLTQHHTLKGPYCTTGDTPIWFHELFETIAQELPYGIAVIDEAGQYTYQELNRKAEAIANAILDITQGRTITNVALLLNRTWLSLAATLAAMKLGITYLPIEPDSPFEFVRAILEDAKTSLLIVDDDYKKCSLMHVYAHFMQVISLDNIPNAPELFHTQHPKFPENPAVLLYTSGTTGKPKGVLVEHQGLYNVISCVVSRMQIQKHKFEDACVEYSVYDASPTFDTCFLQLFPILWNGGTVLIVPTNPLTMTRCSCFFKHITFLSTTPRKLSLYCPNAFECATNVAVGGEDPSIELYKKWRNPNRTLWNLYGPAEISVITTMGSIEDHVHLGQAVDNSLLKICNDSQVPVPVGVPGELYVFGKGVARGYTCEETTRRLFGVDPSGNMRSYRTGDLVVLDGNHILKYIGRIPSDKQVKIGGMRVELLGIEYALRQFPCIEYAKVEIEKPANNVNLVVAYVAPDTIDTVEIIRRLKVLFPEHMVPSCIIPIKLSDAKLSTTGKIQLDPSKYRDRFSPHFKPPQLGLEEDVLSVYREHLGITHTNTMGMSDSLKAYGGDSVIAVSISHEIRRKFMWNVHPLEILKCTPDQIISKYNTATSHLSIHPNIVLQSKSIDIMDNQFPQKQTSTNPVLQFSIPELSSMQKSLLVLNAVQAGPAYNVPLVFEITGSLNMLRFVCTIKNALSLFSSQFKNISTAPVIKEVDLSELPCNARHIALLMIQRDACTPIDFKPLPYRCTIYSSYQHCILSLIVHHSVFDYHSWSILQHLIEKLYCSTLPVSCNHTDQKSMLMNYIKSEHITYTKHKKEIDEFWCNHLYCFPCFIPFPTSFQRCSMKYHRGRRHIDLFNCHLYQSCHRFCVAFEVHPMALFLSIFALMIQQFSHSNNFCIAVICSRRTTAELKRAVGFIASTLVCSFPCGKLSAPFFELLQYTQSWYEDAMKYGCIPFDKLFQLWGYDTSNTQPSYHFPQFILNFISDFHTPTIHLGEGLTVDPIYLDTFTSKAELLLDVWFSEDYFANIWEYDSHLFAKEAIDQCVSKLYLQLLNYYLTHYHSKLSDFQQISSSIPELLAISDNLRSSHSLLDSRELIFSLSRHQEVLVKAMTNVPHVYWGYFNGICSLKVPSRTTKMDVEHAADIVVRANPYLSSVLPQKCDCLQYKQFSFDIGFETALDDIEAEKIRCREYLWPFDIFNGPLFHCTLIHHNIDGIKELVVSSNQILLDEESLMLFCGFVCDALQTNVFPCSFSAHSTISMTVMNDQCAEEYFKNTLSTTLPLLTSPPTVLPSSSSLPMVTETYFDVLRLVSVDHLPAFCCVVSALMLWIVKRSNEVQLCFLHSHNEANSCFSANEYITPIGFTLNDNISFRELIQNTVRVLSEWETVRLNYWIVQTKFDPYSDYLNPHHEMVVQVVSCSDRPFIMNYTRPFRLHLSFKTKRQAVTFTSSLSAQQAPIVHDIFEKLVRTIQSIDNLDTPIITLLQSVNVSPSVVQGNQVTLVDKCLPHMILQAITNRPETVFCYYYADTPKLKSMNAITYRELGHQSKVLVKTLCSIVEAKQLYNRHLAILMWPKFELPISIVAAVLSHLTFTILDPTEQQHTLLEKLKVVNPAMILYDIANLEVVKYMLQSLATAIPILVDAFGEPHHNTQLEVHVPDNDIPSAQCCSNESAYIMFTSGSTGQPKAAPISVVSFCNFLEWHRSMIQSTCPLNWLQCTSLSFDISVAEFLGQLYCGNTLFLSDIQRKLDLEKYFLKIMKLFNIEGLHVVPTFLSYMLQTLSSLKLSLHSLRHLFSTGEKLNRETCTHFFQMFQNASLHNWGGPTECAIEMAHCILSYDKCISDVPIGIPAYNSEIEVVNPLSLAIVPKLIPGEVMVTGAVVFNGYLNHPIDNILIQRAGKTWYRTQDIGYINSKNHVVLLHRIGSLRKIAGRSVDLQGVSSLIKQLCISEIQDIIIDTVDDHKSGLPFLVCFPVVSAPIHKQFVQEKLLEKLPERYVPRVIQCLKPNEVPLLSSGKINYRVLRQKAHETMFENEQTSYFGVSSESGKILLEKLADLGFKHLDLSKRFMTLSALGLTSMHMVHLFEELKNCGVDVDISTLLIPNTLEEIVRIIETNNTRQALSKCLPIPTSTTLPVYTNVPIAILTVQVNLPGATSCSEFWDVINNRRDVITHNLPQPQCILGVGVHGQYIGSRGLIKDRDKFDAELFNIPDARANMLDPQQRILIQMVWTALEEVGYAPTKFSESDGKRIGCFAGVQFPPYILNCLDAAKSKREQDDAVWNNCRDNASLLIGQLLDFRGPCVTIANNCATFAVALHYARYSLMLGECDIAVVAAGTVASDESGYYWSQMDIYSSDGQCRPFSTTATGTVMSDGLVVTVLKRLPDAEREGDDIMCLIKGSAVGSDGALAGIVTRYVPSANGQKETLNRVFQTSGIDSNTISLVEAHGTGTKLGDQVELESLTDVFSKSSSLDKRCILGSVKGNIGHIGVAAAGPSIAKAVLALKHAQLPPSINCTDPLPQLKNSNIFEVIQSPIPWPPNPFHNRRALVHSIGALGTNCAIILEEYVHVVDKHVHCVHCAEEQSYPICISAKSQYSLGNICCKMRQHISQLTHANASSILKDISHTLIVGRKNLSIRTATVVKSLDELDKWLCIAQEKQSYTKTPVIIVFSGLGQCPDSSTFKVFYELCPSFKNDVLMCFHILRSAFPEHATAINNLISETLESGGVFSIDIINNPLQHVLNVVYQVAMYHTLKSLGVTALCIMGHSLGEYTAAYACGALSLEDMLKIVFMRSVLVDEVKYDGKMLRVDLAGEELQQKTYFHKDDLQIACFNSPKHCVVSGSSKELHTLQGYLISDHIRCDFLPCNHAFHHPSLKEIQNRFVQYLENVKVGKLETVWVTSIHGHCRVNHPGSVIPVEYWLEHLTSAVNFCLSSNIMDMYISENFNNTCSIIDIGVQSLLRFLLPFNMKKSEFNVLSFSLKSSCTDILSHLTSLWQNGIDVEFHKMPLFLEAKRIKLPTYPFNLQTYWIHSQIKHHTPVENIASSKTSTSIPKSRTIESIQEFIMKHIGHHFMDSFPEDSAFLTSIKESVQSQYQVNVSQLLLEKKTPSQVAEYIFSFNSITPNYIDCMQMLTASDDTKPTMFIMHAVGGKLYSFLPLATSLSKYFQVYGVYASAIVLDCGSTEQLAAFFLNKIREVQKKGPYYIGGFSFGAWLAHAIAANLLAEGEQVELLALIDPIPLEAVDASVLKQHPEFLNTVATYGDIYITHALQTSSAPGVLLNFARNFFEQYQLLLQYKNSCSPVHCSAVVFLAEKGIALEHNKQFLEPKKWLSVSSFDLQIVTIPGTHGTCIASTNCCHIASTILNRLKLCYENVAIPVCSDHEIQGTWKLCTIESNGQLCSCNSQTQFKVVKNNYVCIVPELIETKNPMLLAFLNSSGTFEVLKGKSTFKIEMSVYYPKICPCEIIGDISSPLSAALRISIDSFVFTFSTI